MNKQGILYIVATPLGNLGDITIRAIEILKDVDCIAAEDTRHSQRLLRHLGISKKQPLIALHDHNERDQSSVLLTRITQGESIALISDAGTPLISDPGYVLVRTAHEKGIQVVPIPGACALIAALSASGLPTDKFCFEGFLAAKTHAREEVLQGLSLEPRTLVFYEAPHRILDTLQSMHKILGSEREATLARELTKTFETIKQGTLLELLNWVEADANQTRGEIVLIVKGAIAAKKAGLTPDVIRILSILMSDLSLKQAVELTVKITGIRKHEIYDYALTLKEG
jgi:16S rRNA (cytidine1402-2'-O)-methyltransferase